jgi:hypothetical protein
MRRCLLVASLGLALAACQVPADRSALPPLPEKVTPVPYAELLTRLRAQAQQANEAFFVDRWAELEEIAKGLELTAKYLARAEDVPAKHKDTLSVAAGDLGKEAVRLREAAQAKNVKRANTALQRLHLKIRDLRLGS